MLRIVIAEDHDIVRRGVRELLSSHPDWMVAAEARTGRQALEAIRHSRPDVAVVDLSLPELAGLDVIRRIRVELPATEICVFSMHDDEGLVAEAIAAGARAYVLKSDAASCLLDAVEALARREAYFTPRAMNLVVLALSREHAGDRTQVPGPLTQREREIAQLLVEGFNTRSVATRLGIAVKTVETHRVNIMRKLGMDSMADLVRYAIRTRLVDP